MRFMSWKAGILLDSLWYHVKKTEENGDKQEHIRQRHELVESNSSFQPFHDA